MQKDEAWCDGRSRQICRDKELLNSDIYFICQKFGSCFFLRNVFFVGNNFRERERGWERTMLGKAELP